MGISVGTYDTAIPLIEYARAECTMLTIRMYDLGSRIGQIFMVTTAFRKAVSIDYAAPGGRKYQEQFFELHRVYEYGKNSTFNQAVSPFLKSEKSFPNSGRSDLAGIFQKIMSIHLSLSTLLS